MKRLVWILALALPAARAHMISMSTGELRIDGRRAAFELRMPLYEIQHVRQPERALLAGLRFSSAGAPARMVESRCREEKLQAAYFCEAAYEFAAEVERVTVESTLPSVTVANHVHLLRAVRGAASDQAVLDLSFPRAELRFRPPTAAEMAWRQAGAGMMRAVGGAAPLLFLAALVLAARSRRELLVLAAMLVAGETVACLVVPLTGWHPAPRFVEAAAALTIAYLAVEILVLPQAGRRWLVVAVLGLFHGLYFAIFAATSDYRAGYVLAGVAGAQWTLIGLLAWVFSRAHRLLAKLQPVRIAAGLLLAVGLVWFFVRLRG